MCRFNGLLQVRDGCSGAAVRCGGSLRAAAHGEGGLKQEDTTVLQVHTSPQHTNPKPLIIPNTHRTHAPPSDDLQRCIVWMLHATADSRPNATELYKNPRTLAFEPLSCIKMTPFQVQPPAGDVGQGLQSPPSLHSCTPPCPRPCCPLNRARAVLGLRAAGACLHQPWRQHHAPPSRFVPSP